MSVRRWKETGKLPVFVEHREGSFVLHSDYTTLEKAAGEMYKALRNSLTANENLRETLLKMGGDRMATLDAVIGQARTALAAFDKAKGENRG